jgi:hypothetical protein
MKPRLLHPQRHLAVVDIARLVVAGEDLSLEIKDAGGLGGDHGLSRVELPLLADCRLAKAAKIAQRCRGVLA